MFWLLSNGHWREYQAATDASGLLQKHVNDDGGDVLLITKHVVATAEFSVDMIIINISLVYLVKTEPNLVIVIQTCCTSPPYSPLLRTPMFGRLLCGNWLVCGRLRPWCISFSFFFVAQLCTPKQWYYTPPACCTSSPFFTPLWAPIFDWLLCEPLLISGHPKAMEYFI